MPEPLQVADPIVWPDGTPVEKFRRLWQSLFRRPVFVLAAEQDPPLKGDMVIVATSDTTLTFKYQGSDGVVRSGSITLS